MILGIQVEQKNTPHPNLMILGFHLQLNCKPELALALGLLTIPDLET